MAALATTHSLNDYPRLSIAQYREQLKRSNSDSLQASYRYRNQSYNYLVQLTKTRCNYGGYRYWFNCPSCSKRVSVLYCAGRYVCRGCIGACYQSQLQQPIDRLFSRADAIRKRLGWQAGIAHGIGTKPKGMHSKTFDRLVNEHDRLTAKIWQQTLDKLGCTS